MTDDEANELRQKIAKVYDLRVADFLITDNQRTILQVVQGCEKLLAENAELKKRLAELFRDTAPGAKYRRHEEDQLDSLFEPNALSKNDIQAMLALPIRPYVP